MEDLREIISLGIAVAFLVIIASKDALMVLINHLRYGIKWRLKIC